jgi:hypothetical protein
VTARKLADVRDVEQAMRQTLVELSLTSTIPARAYVGIVTTSGPDSTVPTGGRSPADHWGAAYDAARTDRDRFDVLRDAREELGHLRRRRFAVGTARDGEDLRERVVTEGEGAPVEVVAIALRCTPTFVRRSRLAASRDAERGRRVEVLEPRDMIAAGLSIRAVAIVTGIPRSTLHGQITTHR